MDSSNHEKVNSVKEVSSTLMRLAMEGASIARKFPSSEDQSYLISLYPELETQINSKNMDCIRTVESLLNLNHTTQSVIPSLQKKDVDEILDQYKDIVEVTDEKLEFLDHYFDEIRKGAKPQKPAFEVKQVNSGSKTYHVHSATVQRPQLQFEPIDNSKSPYVPKLSQKYNAKIPFEEVWKKYKTLLAKQEEDTILPNPYEYEIEHFEYLPRQLETRKEEIYLPITSTPFTWIDNVETLKAMSSKLEKVKEIAIDLEHHSYYSYQGFTCLLQISTREEDFIVDTIGLRNELQILNKSFTNPEIVKVLHGSDNDILWLQRDLGVYVVNLFDTGQASRLLQYPKFSLSYLLTKFCDVSFDKKYYQLADWRIRPLPQDFIDYARADTHYLLYIYDRMHNELLEKGNKSKNLLITTLNNSRGLCKKAYAKDIFQPSLDSLQLKCTGYNKKQNSVLEALFNWRDYVAREEDNSVRYILPNHQLTRIAELMPLDPIELLSCCNPKPPPYIKANSTDVIQVIKDALNEKEMNFVPSKPSKTNLGPLQQNLNVIKESEPLLDSKITQEELFKSADWFHSPNKRTASLHPQNENKFVFSTTTNFFSPSKPKQNNSKVTKVNSSLFSSFTFGTKVPESMEEIYQFSNANRKRNKEKKRLKEDSINAGPVSPIKFGEEEVPAKSSEKQKNPQEFMKKIGWLNESSEEPKALINKETKRNHKNEKSKKNIKQPTESYDYSSHKSSNFGLKKDQPRSNRKQKNEDQTTVSVPSFGRSSNRVRSGRSSQRGKSYISKNRGRNQRYTKKE